MSTWEYPGSFWISPKSTVGLWLNWGTWLGPTFIQAVPIAVQPDQKGKKIFVMDQAVRYSGWPVQAWEFGADIYNPNDMFIQYRIFGLE